MADAYVPPHRQDSSSKPSQPSANDNQDATSKTPHSGVYDVNKMPRDVVKSYRAAGVLPYVVRSANTAHGTKQRSVTFLVGKQDTKSQDRRWRQRWVEFGGKLEESDQGVPEKTARRELHEETSGCLGAVRLHTMCVWNAPCKFVLYFGEVLDDLPQTMPTNDEISEYRFVDRETFLRALRFGTLHNAEISFRTRSSLQGVTAWNLIRSL